MFKKRGVEPKFEKTLTIIDSKTNEVKSIIDIIDEVKEISLKDENISEYSEMQLKDMSFMKTLRDTYPDMKDMETFLTDACKSYKPIKDEVILTDEEKLLEQAELDKIAEAEGKVAKILTDAELKISKDKKVRQLEIEEAERVKHDAAQKK